MGDIGASKLAAEAETLGTDIGLQLDAFAAPAVSMRVVAINDEALALDGDRDNDIEGDDDAEAGGDDTEAGDDDSDDSEGSRESGCGNAKACAMRAAIAVRRCAVALASADAEVSAPGRDPLAVPVESSEDSDEFDKLCKRRDGDMGPTAAAEKDETGPFVNEADPRPAQNAADDEAVSVAYGNDDAATDATACV
jgi:hypothetical protein